MKVFLSWSGERSKYVAETLSNWLEQVLQALEPWVSSDIEKGKRWDSEVSKKLENSKVAIICLTKENLDSTWIHFEAGAISKSSDAYVCTFLLDITPANVKEPLSLFQATLNNKEDAFKLVKTINNLLDGSGAKSLREGNLESVFETFWPQLQEKLSKVPPAKVQQKNVRSDRELMEETLQIVRSLKESQEPLILSSPVRTESLNNDLLNDVRRALSNYMQEKNIHTGEMQNIQVIDFRRYLRDKFGISVSPPQLRIYMKEAIMRPPEVI